MMGPQREVWGKLKYFSPSDAFGEPDRMDEELLYRLDDWRGFLGVPILITCGTQGAHVENSQHYLGKAVDVVVPGFDGHLLDLYFSAERFGFHGIGLYPDWAFKANRIGGLHVDTRALSFDQDGTVDYTNSRWLGVRVDGKQEYQALDFLNLKKYGVI